MLNNWAKLWVIIGKKLVNILVILPMGYGNI